MSDNLSDRDVRHVWHPCSQMQDYEDFTPVHVAKANGPYLFTADGRRIIDAVSSWWCKSLGHANQRVKDAVVRQLDCFEHVIAANTCTTPLVELSERLAALCPGLDRVFYAGDGSSGMEVALKMSLQYHAQTGNPGRNRFMALQNGYHGETILTLAAGDCERFSKPFVHLMPDFPKLGPLPYVSGPDDPGWDKLAPGVWEPLAAQLDAHAHELAALVFEPVVQGSGGMLVYSPALLRRFRSWADAHGVQLIADEIMTGMGRTGKYLACEHAGIMPDFAVFSKGLAAGWAPLTAVVTSDHVYEAFYGDYFSGKAFLHSNTYSGYSLGAAAALEVLKVYEDEGVVADVAARGPGLKARMAEVARRTGCMRNVRGVGFIAAADLVDPATGEPFPARERMGYRCFRRAVELGAWLRPIGDTLYFLPPLNTPEQVLDELMEITITALRAETGQ